MSSIPSTTVALQLPVPRAAPPPPNQKKKTTTTSVRPVNSVPSYEERCRAAALAASLPKAERPKLFVPRQLADFGDGGAFPEIHVAQYPRHMGNPHIQRPLSGGATSTAIVNVEVDATGSVSYDAIVKGGTNSDKLVYSKLEDMRGGPARPDEIALPTPEEEAEEAARTSAALQSLLLQKTALEKAAGTAMIQAATSQNVEQKTEFIKYTARPDAPGYNPAAATRIIQMVPAKLDPLMPPKHKHVKAPRGPAEDPVPVLQAPPAKLTKEEQAAWQVPACISNWKNPRGYTIPLDKRLAADGRGLLGAPSVNATQFAALAESLQVAERQARQEVQLRARTHQQLIRAEAEEREAALRALAQQARRERGGAAVSNASALPKADDASIDSAPSEDDEKIVSSGSNRVADPDIRASRVDTDEEVAARQREKLRLERKRERERELRLEANVELKKKQRLEEERDVSEKIALGVHTTGAGADNVDARLYNQSAGMDSGFGAEDEYNAYSKPLFAAAATGGSIYRPTRGDTEYNADDQYDRLQVGAASKFQPHQGFGGAEHPVSGVGPRTEPVQFEKAKSR
jgi:SNW domain-containing protein 1